jgi:hypothetical protein
MRRLVALATVLALTACSQQNANTRAAEAAADSAAIAWLGLVDAGEYAQSWATSAQVFRNAISQQGWVSRVSAVRDPLGAVKSRRISSSRFRRSLPGAPDGEYVVIQFSTRFEHKAAATETVTPMKEPDGRWHVSGYYIR